MIVLSRQTDESILIGDQITVTVITIDNPRVELLISIRQSLAAVETTVNLQQGQQINLSNEIGIAILNIAERKAQIGVVAPEGTSVKRFEKQLPAPRAVTQPIFITAAENQFIRIGQHLSIEVTDVDASGIRVVIKGELVGGPEDGRIVNEAREVAINSDLAIGTLITITLMRVAGTLSHLSVVRPPHMKIEVG